MCKFKRSDFLRFLENLGVQNWQEKYRNPHILDGMEVKLELWFSGQKEPKKICCLNDFPPKFNRLLCLCKSLKL